MKSFSLIAYTFSHFAVDYICFWILFGSFTAEVSYSAAAGGFILYNFIAFGLQMIIGAYCDENRKFPAGAAGCAAVSVAAVLSYFSSGAGLLFCAIGNALFHVGGGIDSLVHAGGKLGRSGIFVSAGALGVFYGTFHAGRFASSGMDFKQAAMLAAFGIFCGVACFIANKKCPAEGDANIIGAANSKAAAGTVIVLALVSVLIRSFGGTVIPMEWKVTEELGLISAFAAFGGKFAGGILADSFGAKRTGVISLMLSLPLIILGRNNAAVSVLGILLFNMTMPITLGIIAEKIPKNPGIAFGLTTAALLIGVLPGFFVSLGGNAALLIPAVIVSSVCMLFAADNKKLLKEAEK